MTHAGVPPAPPRPVVEENAEVSVPERFPLSVVLVLATSTGGIGQHVRSLAAGLAGRGVTVTVAGPARTQELFGFRAVGARFHAVEIATRPRPVADVAAARRLHTLFKTADLAHAHGLRAGMLSSLAAGRRCATPLVVTWHNAVLATGPRRALLELLERQVARRADITLGASADLVDRARELGALDARFAPVAAPPLGPRTRDPEEVREELGATRRPLVLAVGRLAPQKSYGLLLDAAAVWARQNPVPLVVVAGEGPERGPLQARIDAERLPVRLLGHRDDVPDLLAAADVAVLTSRWEARAIVAQEALRAGVPLVATRVGGVPELVGDAAVLVRYGDAAGLADAVSRLLADPAERRRLAELGREQARTWPDEADTVQQVLAVYQELLRR